MKGLGGPGRLSRALFTTSCRRTFQRNHVAPQIRTAGRRVPTIVAEYGGEGQQVKATTTSGNGRGGERGRRRPTLLYGYDGAGTRLLITNDRKACIPDRALRKRKEFAETCVAKRDYHENVVRSFRGACIYRGRHTFHPILPGSCVGVPGVSEISSASLDPRFRCGDVGSRCGRSCADPRGFLRRV